MRVVIQRVSHASVTINGTCKSAIKKGFLVLLGIEEADNQEDADWLCKKIIGLRVFDDENGVMNKSILEAGGDILVVSQFTLMASTKKGNRPSYIRAARHETAIPLYEYFCNELSIGLGKQVGTGEFGADMKVELLNDGPVTICMDGFENFKDKDGYYCFHAGTRFKDGEIVTNGGRVLGITAKGKTLKEARKNAYEATEWIDFANKYMRHDIGKAIDEA